MEYTKPKFTVALQSEAYRERFSEIDWSISKPTKVFCRCGVEVEDVNVQCDHIPPAELLYSCQLCTLTRAVAPDRLCESCAAAAGP